MYIPIFYHLLNGRECLNISIFIIFIYCYASIPDAAACVCLPREYGRFMLLIDNNLLLPGAKLHILNNIYRK